GSVLLPTLRSIFTSAPIGQTNREDNRRVVPALGYVYGVVMSAQPTLLGGLFDGHVAGTPQRFTFSDVSDPNAPDVAPPWPGPITIDLDPTMVRAHKRLHGRVELHVFKLPDEVVEYLRKHRRLVTRHEIVTDELDAHRNLIRLKIAGLLAVLD